MDYKIISTFYEMPMAAGELTRKVKEAMSEGWEPQGPPQIDANGCMHQAMIKKP